jgi:hypothetical protein
MRREVSWIRSVAFMFAIAAIVASCGSDNRRNVVAEDGSSLDSAPQSESASPTSNVATTSTSEPLTEVTEAPTTTSVAVPTTKAPKAAAPVFEVDPCGDNVGPARWAVFTGTFWSCGRSFSVRADCNSGVVTVTIRDPGGEQPEGWLSIGMLVDDESIEPYTPAPRAAGDVLSSPVQRNVTVWGSGQSTRPARVEYDCRN